MSTTATNGTKIVLPRSGANEFWARIAQQYPISDRHGWKLLAMLALRENGGWPLEWIGAVFGHSKGHCTRCIQQIKAELATQFEPAAAEVLPRPLDDED